MEINTILNLLITHKLTADELLLVYLTFLAQDEENHPEHFVKWFQNGGQEKLKDLFISLKEKGIIIKSYNPKSYIPNEIEFNKNFMKSWIKNSGELGKELMENYEPFLYLNGKFVPLKGISKRFTSFDEFYFHYSSTIGHSIEKHNEIMEILKWARENKKITFGILSFVIDQRWEDLKLMRDSKFEGEVTDTYDLYESV